MLCTSTSSLLIQRRWRNKNTAPYKIGNPVSFSLARRNWNYRNIILFHFTAVSETPLVPFSYRSGKHVLPSSHSGLVSILARLPFPLPPRIPIFRRRFSFFSFISFSCLGNGERGELSSIEMFSTSSSSSKTPDTAAAQRSAAKATSAACLPGGRAGGDNKFPKKLPRISFFLLFLRHFCGERRGGRGGCLQQGNPNRSGWRYKWLLDSPVHKSGGK